MAYTKVEYNPVNWKNKSEGLITPLDKRNLNNMDDTIEMLADSLDVAYNELDVKKLDVGDGYKIITEMPTWDEKTGILKFKFYDGTEFAVDFNVEKIPVSFSMDEKGTITMVTKDGTEWTADVGTLTPNYVYDESERIAVTTEKSEDGFTHVKLDLKKGSITDDFLANDYLSSIIAETLKAQTAANDAKGYADNASQSASNADYDAKLAQSYAIGESGVRDGEDTDNAKYYKGQASDAMVDAESARDDAKLYADRASSSASKAMSNASSANDSANSANASANSASTSAESASASATSAAESEKNASASATSASASEKSASDSKTSASESATSASTSANNASVSATSAAGSASSASTSATNASASEKNASASATSAAGSATSASASEANAKTYYEQTKAISESFAGTLRPKGTVTFAKLPSVASAKAGDMYNISDEFTTTSDFAEGAGNVIPLGSNVYKNSDGKWDVLAGSPVTGVKGSAETTYRRGNVNITKENLGLDKVENTADSEKKVSHATTANSADSAGKATNDSLNQTISATYVKGVSITDHTLSVEKGDGKKTTYTIPDNDTDTNTTYTLTQDANDGHKLTFKGTDGTTTNITIPDNDTKYDLNTMIGGLDEADSTPTDSNYLVSQSGTDKAYKRTPFSKILDYLENKFSYNDLKDKPTIGNGTVTIKQNGTQKASFTMNQTGSTTVELTDTNTNTWRDVVDGLTSDRTDASLSAKQGKVLKGLVDGKQNAFSFSINEHNVYRCLGTATLRQIGEYLFIQIFTGNGYNASVGQDQMIDVHIRTSNGNPNEDGKYYDGYIEIHRNDCPYNVYVVQNSSTSFTIWIGNLNYTGNSFYNVYYSNGASWEESTATSSTAPTNGVALEKRNIAYTSYYSTATESTSGLTKLYTSTGTATDGTMTQNAITSALDGKQNTGYYVTAAPCSDGTIDDLYLQRRGTSGGVGSIYLTKKSSGVGSSIPSGWYNYFYSPHRTGIGEDNPSYATIILTPMTFSGGSYIVRCSGNAVAEVKPILTSVPSASDLTASLGFGTLNTSYGWGTVNSGNGYTVRWGSDQAGGGGIGIGEKSGRTSIQVDGDFYAQEGQKRLAYIDEVNSLSDVSYQRRSVIDQTVDWNTIHEVGCYKFQLSSNTWGDASKLHSPNAYNSGLYGYGLIIVHAATSSDPEKRLVQIYMPHAFGSGAQNKALIRYHNSSSWDDGWGDWKPLAAGLSWSELFDKPSTFTPSSHKQAYTAAECDSYTSDENTLGVTPAAVKKAFTIFEPKSHTHNYLPLSGGTMSGTLRVASDYSNWCEGIRVYPKVNDWTTIILGGKDLGDVGTSPNSWSIHNNNGQFSISRNNSGNSEVSLSCYDNIWRANQNEIITTANISSRAVLAGGIQPYIYGGGAGNTTGYRLIAKIPIDAWSNYRATFSVVSRHQGNGILTIAVGCNSNAFNSGTVYAQIRYTGNVGCGTVIQWNSYTAYVSSDYRTIYVFYQYWDYSACAMTPIGSNSISLRTGDDATWMTSIDASTYGTMIASTEINVADDAHALYTPDGNGDKQGTTFHYVGKDTQPPLLWGQEDRYNAYLYNPSTMTVGYANYVYSTDGSGTKRGMTFNWVGKSGQPSWLWGGEDGAAMYVYNPSNFSVEKSRTVQGSYTANGGQQNPNYFGKNKIGFLMMNTEINGDKNYKDFMIMDCYDGSDLGGATALGIDRQTMRAFIMGSEATRTSWDRSAELITSANIGSQSVSHATVATASNHSDNLRENNSTAYNDVGGLYWMNHSDGVQGAGADTNDTPTNSWWYVLRNRHTNQSNDFYTDVAIPFNDDHMYYKRICNGSVIHGRWIQVLDDLNYSNYALPLSGGTITDRITRNGGGSWISDRNNVVAFGTSTNSGSYNPVVGQKTPNGAWTMGNLALNESLIFNYSTDTNYNAGTNSTTQVYLRNTGGTIALTSDIPTNTNQLTNGAGYITGITKDMVTSALGYTPPRIRSSIFSGTMGTGAGDGGRIGTVSFGISTEDSGASVRILNFESNYSLTQCGDAKTSGTTVTVSVHSDTITSGSPSFGGRVLYVVGV